MDLYIAIRGSRKGKIYDLTEFGLEEMTLQNETNGRKTPAGYTGLIIPYSALEDEIIKLARRGQQVDEKVYEFGRQYN